MVEAKLISKVLKRLEQYFIRKNNFQLKGETYDMILFIPSDKYLSDVKYSLLVSSEKLDNLLQKEVIKELFYNFKEVLKFEEYNAISRLNIIHSEDPFVKNLKFVFGQRQQIIEINDIPIGGIQIDHGYLVKSLVLDKLIVNRALTLEVVIQDSNNQNNYIRTINAGIIRIENNFDVVHYTGKGLREIWQPDMTEEQLKIAKLLRNKPESFLLQNEYIAKTNLENILKVL